MANRANVEIGAYVLESLTTGMYTQPLDAVRELIQNAADSVRRAIEDGLISRNDAFVTLSIREKDRTLVVLDNGIGIRSESAERRLLAIGKTTKTIESDAGFRGIGRLAAIAYCDQLIFRTTAAGDERACTLKLDCVGLREAFAGTGRDDNELAEIFQMHTQVSYADAEVSEHYFEVTLGAISEVADEFLDEVRLEDYLSQVAPVEYDAQRFVYRKVLEDWLAERQVPLNTVTLKIVRAGGERQVFKPYKTHYKTQKYGYDLPVRGIECFPEDPLSAGYWIWYGKTDLMGGIAEVRSAGLRLRRNNIQLGGPERVAELFAEVADSNARFNNWFIGEVHLLSSECIPNARRDGIELAGDWPSIREDVVAFLAARCDEIRQVSETRNKPAAKIVNEISSVVDTVAERLDKSLLTRREKASLLDKLDKAGRKLDRALEADRSKDELEQLEPLVPELQDYRQRVEAAREEKDVLPGLDRRQRKLVREILDVLYETLDEPTYHRAADAIATKLGCRPEHLRG